jgi:hypothetical protein
MPTERQAPDAGRLARVYVRNLATREIVHSIDVTERFARSSNYWRFLSGLVMKTRAGCFVDDSEVAVLLRELDGAAGGDEA